MWRTVSYTHALIRARHWQPHSGSSGSSLPALHEFSDVPRVPLHLALFDKWQSPYLRFFKSIFFVAVWFLGVLRRRSRSYVESAAPADAESVRAAGARCCGSLRMLVQAYREGSARAYLITAQAPLFIFRAAQLISVPVSEPWGKSDLLLPRRVVHVLSPARANQTAIQNHFQG